MKCQILFYGKNKKKKKSAICCLLNKPRDRSRLSKSSKLLGHPMMFVCVVVLRPSQPSGVMSSAVSLPNHTFTGQA